MLAEWLLVSITAIYAFLTHKIAITMKRTNEISMESLRVSQEMIAELKQDRDLRFRPYIVPIDCKIDGSRDKDQYVILKNVGGGPAINCAIILFLITNDEILSIMMGMSSISLSPGGDGIIYLVKFDNKTRVEALISFFPEHYHKTIYELIGSSRLESALFNLLGFENFGSIYFLSYKNVSEQSYLYKSSLVRVENKYKIGSNPILADYNNNG